VKRLLEFLQKLLGKAAVPALLLLLAVLIFPPMVSAQYGGSGYGCSPGYCPPSYGYAPKSYGYTPRYYNTRSGWVYRSWPQDPKYYFHYYTIYDHCGKATNHNDGWLYTLDSYGCYHKHCLISQYAYKLEPSRYIEPRGATEVGYYRPEYELARAFPYLVKPGVIHAQESPRFLDPHSVIAPLNDQESARLAFAEKSVESVTSMGLKIAERGQAIEAEKVRARGQLASQAQNDNTKLQILAKLNEIVATIDRTVTIDAGATPRAIINVGNPALAALIQDRCVSCHGPSKAEGGLNFSNVAASDVKVWQAAFRKSATGEMPKGGEPLTDDELDLFDEQYQLSLKAR
jgi:mono/diheme cytochrome c family protein